MTNHNEKFQINQSINQSLSSRNRCKSTEKEEQKWKKKEQTWPLQKGPAPMPMVGMSRAEVTAAATSAGTHSNTTEKHPASCSAIADSTT